jgi:hypothetical protein
VMSLVLMSLVLMSLVLMSLVLMSLVVMSLVASRHFMISSNRLFACPLFGCFSSVFL